MAGALATAEAVVDRGDAAVGVFVLHDALRLGGSPRIVSSLMLEGLVQGLLGAALACVAVRVLNSLVESRVTEGQSLAILQNFSVSTSEVNGTLLLLLLVGGLVGAIGSGVAVSSYLDV